jgi:O-antigen/teichoic acid export membrane protein
MTVPPIKKDLSPKRHMLRGSMWMLGVRWSMRLMGLASTVILARLLTPADYGVVAIATTIVGMVAVFGQTGQGAAIIRHPNPTREHYDSAWTIAVLIGIGLGLIVFALTPITTAYFHEPRAAKIVEILALQTALMGFQNAGVVDFRRNLEFHKQFWFSVVPPVFAFVIGIVAALLLRNYWALVIGAFSESAVTFVLGYVMSPFRPRICFTKVGEIWSFSIWTLITNVGAYFNTLVDRVAIGGFAGTAAMGRYYAATDLATSPSAEIVGPLVMTLFPVMAKVQDDSKKRRELYLTVLYWSALVCSSTAIGVALVANDMVDLVLGSQWEDVKPLMPWLALGYGMLGLSNCVYTALYVLNMPLVAARLQWIRLLGLGIAVFTVAYMSHQIEAVAATRFVVTLIITPTLFVPLARVLDLTLRDFLATLWRPFTAGAVMALVVYSLNEIIPWTGNLRLMLDIATGVLTYGVSLMALWFWDGQPNGPERNFWYWLRDAAAPLRRYITKPSLPNTPSGEGG